MMIHEEPSDLARKMIKIKNTSTHFQFSDFGGSDFEVEDWWDRVGGRSWGDSDGNPACLVYAMRRARNNLPIDDKVLYGKVGVFGHLVHISELELAKEVKSEN